MNTVCCLEADGVGWMRGKTSTTKLKDVDELLSICGGLQMCIEERNGIATQVTVNLDLLCVWTLKWLQELGKGGACLLSLGAAV